MCMCARMCVCVCVCVHMCEHARACAVAGLAAAAAPSVMQECARLSGHDRAVRMLEGAGHIYKAHIARLALSLGL
jgi:hypothetical protein